ncbi:CU044_2847 family protein [Streptomyces sp. NPDC005708]|uniref:CU044_2847 family protein n=1 Tax=Streptomyces sp. NPDC005708 TaxID=3154564 RepID=UPI0033C29758
MPQTRQQALGPVTAMARAALEQLRKAGPDEVEIEFGVDLAAQAGGDRQERGRLSPEGDRDLARRVRRRRSLTPEGLDRD